MSTLDKYILRQKIRATQYVFAFLGRMAEVEPEMLVSSPCQRQSELLPSLRVRRPLTFHILIFSSKTTYPNELTLIGKHLSKEVLYKDCTFYPHPISSMATTGNSCFWLVDFFKYSPLKPFGPKLDRKHLSKVLYKDCTFRRDPVTNMVATSNYCFWMGD